MALSDRLPRLRRISSLVLVVAAFVVYFGVVAPNAAEDFAVTLQLQGTTDHVTRIDIVWTQVDAPESEPTVGTTFNYKAGLAPPNVKTTVHAPAGSYWLDLTVTQTNRQDKLRRHVVLDSEATTVFIPLPSP